MRRNTHEGANHGRHGTSTLPLSSRSAKSRASARLLQRLPLIASATHDLKAHHTDQGRPWNPIPSARQQLHSPEDPTRREGSSSMRGGRQTSHRPIGATTPPRDPDALAPPHISSHPATTRQAKRRMPPPNTPLPEGPPRVGVVGEGATPHRTATSMPRKPWVTLCLTIGGTVPSPPTAYTDDSEVEVARSAARVPLPGR